MVYDIVYKNTKEQKTMTIQQYTIKRIRHYLRERNLSITKLAEKSVMPPSTLKNILYGRSKNTGITTIQWICYGLGITVQDFFADYKMSGEWWNY